MTSGQEAALSASLCTFTTNHIDKLGPALIQWSRMDKHIERQHCDPLQHAQLHRWPLVGKQR
jgi:hypothetical protein